MLKHEYMVIYHYQDGLGRICITMDNKIKEFADVESLEQYLKSKRPELEGLIITDFKFLRTFDSSETEIESNTIKLYEKERKMLEELAGELSEDILTLSAAHTQGHIVLFKDGEELAWFMHNEVPRGEIYIINLKDLGWALDMRANY